MTTTAPDLQALFDGAVNAFQAGNLEGASDSCAVLLEHAGDHPAALNLMGLVKQRQSLSGEAADLFRRAADAAPNDAGIRRNLGNALKRAGKMEEAMAAYEAAATLAPGDAAARFDFANALAGAGQINRAVDTYRHVLKLKPDHKPALLALARLAEQRGDPAGAAEALQSALALEPESGALLLSLGHALRRAGRLGEAIERYREAVAKQEDNAEALGSLGYSLGESGRLDEAVEAYRKSLALTPDDAGMWSNLGWTLAEMKRFEDAIEACERATALDAGLPGAHYHLGLALRGTGEPARAAAALEQAIAIDRRHVRATSLLGAVREELGDLDAARRLFDFDRMIEGRMLDGVEGFADIAEFNRALAGHVLGHPSLMWNRPGRSTTDGSQTLDLAREEAPALRALRAEADRAVRAYLAARAAESAEGEFFFDPPEKWDLAIWGVVLGAGGHQFAHLHPSGIVSGVYYPTVPATIGDGADGNDGYLEFCTASGRDEPAGLSRERRRIALRPEEGRLVLFPSYFWHSTVPFTGPEHRMSVAFDAIPK